MHDAAKSPDPSRPPPEYVLRTFSHGIGFEDVFLDLCVKAHNSPPQATPQEDCDNFVKSIRSLSDVSDFHKLEAHVNSSIFHGESSKCQNVENKNDPTLAQVPFPMAGDDVTSSEHRDGFHGPVPIIEETLSSGTIEVSNTKVTCLVFVSLLIYKCAYFVVHASFSFLFFWLVVVLFS